jgi:hypothetical protein
LEDSSELSAQEVSEVLSNKNTSDTSNENEQLSDTERSETRCMMVNDIGQNESFLQQGNTNSVKSPSSENHGEVTDNCTSLEEHNLVSTPALPEKGVLLRRKESFVENDIPSDSECAEERRDNDDDDASTAATLEKPDDSRSKSDLDELLENFINDSDIDDSLLNISSGL